jgi:hypothetical protein
MKKYPGLADYIPIQKLGLIAKRGLQWLRTKGVVTDLAILQCICGAEYLLISR